jgi:hypothetical protein
VALVFASHLCEMCAMCCKKRKSNLDLASKRLSLDWRLSLSDVHLGEYPSDFTHKLKILSDVQHGENLDLKVPV